VEKQVEELKAKGAQLIWAEYADPSDSSSFHHVRLLFWYRDVPILRRDLLAVSKSHPLAEIGNLALTDAPPILKEARVKHAEAMALEEKRSEITPEIDNPDYIGWKGFAPNASATYVRNTWQQREYAKHPTMSGTEIRTLQSIDDTTATVKVSEQSETSTRARVTPFKAKIPDRRNIEDRQPPVEEELELKGRKFKCSRRTLHWHDAEENSVTTVWTSSEVPGGLVRRLVDTQQAGNLHVFNDTTLESYSGGRNGDWAGKPEGNPLFRTIFTFTSETGGSPNGPLVQGDDGNFYGTTANGPFPAKGSSDYPTGSVFKISPDGEFTTLHLFHNTDGATPSAGLTKGRDGNFYGTTRDNGLAAKGAPHTTGFGTLFKMTSSGSLTTLHYFGEPPDAENPTHELLLASDGNFYGTTKGGGSAGHGTVFRITPSGKYAIIHSFEKSPNEGTNPIAPLVEGPDHGLYGVTAGGGQTAKGTLFKLTTGGELTTLHHFGEDENDGAEPAGGLSKGHDGSFYGSTFRGGGSIPMGTVFKFSPPGDYSIVYRFKIGNDGYHCVAPLLFARDGNAYGTTANGGNLRESGEPPGNGSVFRLDSAGTLMTLHTFLRSATRYGNFGFGHKQLTEKAEWAKRELAAGRDHPEITDGRVPIAGLIEAKDGMLYGMTPGGGIWDRGTIFRINPKAIRETDAQSATTHP
jgi:uncharacterized repeat protein (TIGR03803 family)